MYLLLERGKKREREGEKHPSVAASCTPPSGDLACNPGKCPDQESIRQQASTQSTKPHQPGLLKQNLFKLYGKRPGYLKFGES